MNIITTDKGYFSTIESRTKWCQAHHFLPCDDLYSQPDMDMVVHSDTKFFITATFKPDIYKTALENGEQLRRTTSNLIPTAFVYESDSLNIEEQISNIKKEAMDGILSITYSGNKSVHVIVPIDVEEGKTITDNKEYKYLWEELAKTIFLDTSNLDGQCATIGRLSRLPGATRDNGKTQKCLYYNPECRCVMLKRFRRSWKSRQSKKAKTSASKPVSYRKNRKVSYGSDFDSQLKSLVSSNKQRKSPCKRIAVMVLKENKIPCSNLLPTGGSYVGTLTLLYSKYPLLLMEFFNKVKEAHPTCLPQPFDYYMGYLLEHVGKGSQDFR